MSTAHNQNLRVVKDDPGHGASRLNAVSFCTVSSGGGSRAFATNRLQVAAARAERLQFPRSQPLWLYSGDTHLGRLARFNSWVLHQSDVGGLPLAALPAPGLTSTSWLRSVRHRIRSRPIVGGLRSAEVGQRY